MQRRINYIVKGVVVIGLGLLSRQISFLPLGVGDLLYSVMIYFFLRAIFIHKSITTVAFMSVILCYMIELSQLLQYDWLIVIRCNPLGRLILGQGFLLSDLVAYTVGIVLVMFLDNQNQKWGKDGK